MSKQLTLEVAVESIANWMFTDSRVQVDKQALKDALMDDYAAPGGCYPTEAQCEEIVTGGDEGEPSEELFEHFPNTWKFLESHF